MPSLTGLAPRGFEELHEGQIDFGDAVDIDDNRAILTQDSPELSVSLFYIRYCHIPDKRYQVMFDTRQ